MDQKRILTLSLILALLTAAHGFGGEKLEARLSHELRIRLRPAEHLLIGEDSLSLLAASDDELTLTIAETARIEGVEINGASRPFSRKGDALIIDMASRDRGRPATLRLAYRIRFDDPYPEAPANTDNPGYGVVGTISESGTLLLGGSGWYPDVPGETAAFDLAVTAPKGMIAVTGGAFLGSIDGSETTVSKWRIASAVEPLSLSAGPYVVTETAVDGIDLQTFFHERSQPLAARYLAASGDYIRLYQSLFGPYPFQKFAVVENFFPTGYGFPSYTLIGGTVLRLPFIIHTSLGHEIAHSWWGNGVLIDFSEGNWCEGLTTYVADYLYQERKSPRDALEYRRQWMRNYAALVDDRSDFPVSRFMSRTDPVTKVIGYDKAAMIFHMLRRRVGDEPFWRSLREIYNTYRFKPLAWSDIRTVFEEMTGDALGNFFHQWVQRKGAPEISLADVTLEETTDGWIIRGEIRQTGVPYELRLPVRGTTSSGDHDEIVMLDTAVESFRMVVPERPEVLAVDPDSHLFRKLFPEEVPLTVNHLKNAPDPLLILDAGATDAAASAADLFLRAMGIRGARIIRSNQLKEVDLQKHDVIWFGEPETALDLPESLTLDSTGGFQFMGRHYSPEESALFCVFPHPLNPEKVMALFLSDEASFISVSRKITHYGKYSYLTFKNSVNQEKGTWNARQSPLIVRF